MKLETLAHWCLSTLLVGLAVAQLGCRRRDPYTDGVLEITRAEKMDLEDQIYALEDKLEEREREIEALRGRAPVRTTPAPRSLRATPSTPPPGVMDDAELTPPSIDPGIPLEPRIELPPIEATPMPKPPATPMKPPVRSLKPENTSVEEALVPPSIREDSSSETLPAPQETPTDREPASSEAELIDPQVSSVFINPFHTTGVELDQRPGDDGLNVMFEPRNAAGQFVPQAGEVSIVVLDPALEGDAARIARWDLSKSEVSKRMLDARPERGIKVQLKWPDRRPEHAKLKLFVRYHAADGQQIEGHTAVFVTLPGQISERWTPRRE